jgi:N-acetylmuramoyl-L-alanine amidase
MIIIKKGSRGETVKQIQKALHLMPDGIYGDQTEEAVKAFQCNNGLKVDGIVGPATLMKLIPVRLKKSRRVITEIIVHCTATPEGKDYTVDDVRRWHRQQGWSDIGYHYLIGRHGELWDGRDVDIQGAHCAAGGHNRNSIGVCYVGGLDRDGKTAKDTRTLQQKAQLLSLLYDLRKLYPQARIYGHNDFEHSKACPCFDARSEYKKL